MGTRIGGGRGRERRRAELGAVAVVLLLLLAGVAGCGWIGGDDRHGDDGGARGGERAGADGDAGAGNGAGGAGGSGSGGPGGSAGAAPGRGGAPVCEDTTRAGRPVVLCAAGDVPDQTLVVALHGRGSSVEEMRAVTELERDAAAAGLAVAYPAALDGGWGDDTFPAPGRPGGDEDLRFLDDLVAALRADPRIDDDEPVGVVGFSNGASMALRYAAQRAGDVRAVVAVAGQLPLDPAIRPTGPVPLLAIYGTADPLRPYDTGIPAHPGRRPGEPTPTLSTPDTVAAFVAAIPDARHEGLTESDPDPSDGTRLRTERLTGQDGLVVVLRTVVDGGHTWPSAHAPLSGGFRYGLVSHDLDASAEAIAFVLDPRGPP